MPPVRLVTQLLMFKPWVPRRARFWTLVCFALFYQLAGAVYLAAITQVVGEQSFLSEEVSMGLYCSLIGLNMIFPILFRLKFFFFTRQMFFVSSFGVLVCCVAAFYVNVPWLFWVICTLAGYFKMMGMFACLSTIQLNITPTRSFGVFFPVVYVLVCGAMQLSGITISILSYIGNWRLMYLASVVMMIFINAVTYFMMKPDHRQAPFMPLKGLDWVGQVLWVLTSCTAAWIFAFGNHYDWWNSAEIWRGTAIFATLLVVTLSHARYKGEHAFIQLSAFSYSITYKLALLAFGMGLLQSTTHSLQSTYIYGVLHYDYYTAAAFSVAELVGVVMGAILGYFALIRLRWSMRQFFFCCFTFALAYLFAMYEIIACNFRPEMLSVALFLIGIAETMIETGVTYTLSQAIEFRHFFMNITIVGLVRCGIGSAAEGAIVERVFEWSMLTSGSLEIALRESYGYFIFAGVVMLALILMSNYRLTFRQLLPKLINVSVDMKKAQ